MDIAYLGILAAIATALLWTLSSLAWTSAGREIGALAVSFLRLVITGGILAIYGYAMRGLWLPEGAGFHTWLVLGTSGVFGFFICDLCLFESFVLIGPRLSLLVHSLSPPLAALISDYYLGDKLEPLDWLGMSVTLSGIAWVLLEQPGLSGGSYPRSHFRRGVMLAFGSTVAASIGYVLAKEGVSGCTAADATFIRIIGAMAGYTILLTMSWRWKRMWQAARHRRAMCTVALGAVVGPLLGVILCMVALRHSPVGVAVTIINTMPVLILPLVVIVYKERVSRRAVWGSVVTVVGVALLAV